MKYLPLVLANLGRHKKRTILTVASVALALFLFASLQTVVTTIAAAANFGSVRRLVSTNATGIVFTLPIAYANRLQAQPGVESVTWANWFGGRYGDGKRFFATFAIDPTSYLEMYPEMVMPEDQKQAFIKERTAALVGKKLMDAFGWKLGQNVTMQGTIFPGDWTFTIRAVYVPTDPLIGEDVLMFHHEYMEERLGRPGQAGWYILKIDTPDRAAPIAKATGAAGKLKKSPYKRKSWRVSEVVPSRMVVVKTRSIAIREFLFSPNGLNAVAGSGSSNAARRFGVFTIPLNRSWRSSSL